MDRKITVGAMSLSLTNNTTSVPSQENVVRSSRGWKGSDNMKAGKVAETKFNALDRPKICNYTSSLRNGQSCAVSDAFTHGKYNLVIEILFDDGVSWVARIRLYGDSADNDDLVMESELATMEYVREHSNIPVPTVYASDTGRNNVFDAPFMLMTGMNGEAPDWKTLSVAMKRIVIYQMADIKTKLGNLRFSKIGSLRRDVTGNYSIDTILVGETWAGPFDRGADYYSFFALSAWEDRVNENHKDEESRRHSCFLPWLSRSVVPFISRADLNHGPFPLSHADFGPHNLLIDDNGVITGVLDWSHACTLPWESFCNFPVLMGVNWPKKHRYTDWVWKDLMVQQEYFLEALRKLERDEGFVPKMSELICSDEVKAAEGVESYFNAPWYRDAWCKLLFEMVFGNTADMEKIKEAVCNSFFAIRVNVRDRIQDTQNNSLVSIE
jgi:Phosphotransferase enzyme family